LEGRIITVMSEFRGRMFQACDQHAIEDHRLALGNASYILSFDDDLLFEFSRPTTGSSKRRSLSSIPVIGKVSKASVLVGCHHMFSEAFRAKSTESKAKYPFLMSSGLLEEWAKLKDGKDEPVVHYTHEEKEEHVPLEIDWKEELDEHIPPRPFTPVNTAAEHSHKSPIAVVPPPSILKMEIENIAKYPESDAFSPVKKFTHNGIYMQANAEKLEQTLAFLDKVSWGLIIMSHSTSNVILSLMICRHKKRSLFSISSMVDYHQFVLPPLATKLNMHFRFGNTTF
jgi:hypothetical protein